MLRGLYFDFLDPKYIPTIVAELSSPETVSVSTSPPTTDDDEVFSLASETVL